MLAGHDRFRVDIDRTAVETDRNRQDEICPWQILLSLLTFTAVSFAAGAAFFKLLVP